jgi:stage II sporulation protein E
VNDMPKIEKSIMNPSTDLKMLKGSGATSSQWSTRMRVKAEHVMIYLGFLILIVGFLLGRAYILGNILPFALPFFAAVFIMKKERTALAFLGLLAGSLTVSLQHASYTLVSIILFLVSHFILKKTMKRIQGLLPIQVFFAIFLTHLSLIYAYHQQLTTYDFLMGSIEAGLSYILTIIFLQSVPLLTRTNRRKGLETEEIVCLIILIASVITGTTDWYIYDISVQHVLSRYLILLFAFVAGATIGCTVGVVTGLIMSLSNVASLYQMSLLAFSGLLGGLLKEGKKIGVGLGLLIGTSLISLYGDKQGEIVSAIIESCIAVLLFLITPKYILTKIAKMIPGTEEHVEDQQHYLRKIRDLTSERIVRFSNVFEALSASFSHFGAVDIEDKEDKVDLFLSNVTAKSCQTCFKKDQCWSANFDRTYSYMEDLMDGVEKGTLEKNHKLQREWEKYCVKSTKVKELIEKDLFSFNASQQLKQQVRESRRLVAEQLSGVAKVMEDFAQEIKREKENHQLQEDQILDCLKSFGIDVRDVDIYSVEQGNIDIEMSMPYCQGRGECEKLIAPMLSDILRENIVVKQEKCAMSHAGFCTVSFGSAKKYIVETGLMTVAKGGGLVSGDSYKMMGLGAGTYALAISDGMGNGERAHIESSETVKLLQKILQSGIEETIAIKSINSVLSLRTTDEIFATLDLAMIDLQDATARFLKIGSTPSFIKRGDQVIKVEGSNLPMGIVQEFDVDVVNVQLKAGDLLIMMSDGVYEGARYVENHEMWMKRKIRELQTTDPQDVADLLVEEVIRTKDKYIEDDMTIVVAKIEHNNPKWATIPVYSLHA